MSISHENISTSRPVWIEMENQKAKVIAIILSMGHADETERCVRSLLDDGLLENQIVLVENETVENFERLSPQFPKIHFVRLSQNEGFSSGMNRGIIEAKSIWDPDYHFILNNDAQVAKGAIETLVQWMQKNPDCGIAAPKILSDKNERKIWAAGGTFDRWRILSKNRGQGETDRGQYDKIESCPFLSGCAMMIRKDLLGNAGLFDEIFFTYAEDLDLCLRTRLAGWKLIYHPDAIVYHKGSLTSGTEYEPFQSFYRWRNRFFIAYKHSFFPHRWFLYLTFFPALMTRDTLIYLRRKKFESIPYLWKGLLQFIEISFFGVDVNPLNKIVAPSKKPRDRKRLGTLMRNPLLKLALKSIDFCGYLFCRNNVLLPPPPKNVKRILIAKIDHLGDVLMCLNVLPSIKKRYPEAEIHFVCGSWAKELIEDHPDIGKVFTFDHFMLNRNGTRLQKLMKMLKDFKNLKLLRQNHYDIAVDFRAYFPNFVPFFSMLNVDYKIGFGTAGFGFALDRLVHWREDIHETEHSWDLMRALYIVPDTEEKSWDWMKRESADGLLAESGVKNHRKICVLHPGTGNKIKCWRNEEWRKLIRFFDAQGIQVVCTGSEGEKFLVDHIIENSSGINLCGKTTLPMLVDLVKKAEWVIGVDSFVPHLSSALGTNTVVIFNGIEKISQWKPIGKNVRVVTKEVPCSPCFLKNGCAAMDCLKSTAEDVIAIIQQHLTATKK